MNQHLELITKRTLADYVTLLGFIPFIVSLFLIVKNEPELALLVSAIGFFLDSIDGVIARKTKQESDLGRQLDSSLDLLVYIVFSALFVLTFLNPWTPLTILVVSVVIGFGVLRLLRYNKVGFVYKQGDRCYPGFGTCYVLPAVAVLYILHHFIGPSIAWLTQIALIVIAFAMISNVPIRKPKLYFWYPSTAVILVLLILIYQGWI